MIIQKMTKDDKGTVLLSSFFLSYGDGSFDSLVTMSQKNRPLVILKDHDTDALQVNYDPMLFNDKERPVYESCDHEWISESWPSGEVIVCSKCGVHLDMWLYNGYSE